MQNKEDINSMIMQHPEEDDLVTIQFKIDREFKHAIENEAKRCRTSMSGLIKERMRYCLPKNMTNVINSNSTTE